MLRSILTVLSGTMLAQIIGLVSLPFIARLYDPEGFGRLQLYASVVNILLMLSALRYEFGLLYTRSEADFQRLLATSLRLCVITSMASLIFVAIADIWIAFEAFGFGRAIYLFPLAMLLAGLFNILTYVTISKQTYRLSAESKITQSGVTVSASILLSFTPLAHVGLLLGDILGRLCAAGRILLGSRDAQKAVGFELSWSQMRETLLDYKALPLFTLPGMLVATLTATLMPLYFASRFGLDVLGHYALVERFVIVPLGMLAAAVMQVFTGNLAQTIQHNPATVSATFRRVIGLLSLIGVGLILLGWLTATSAIPLIFGAEWALAGQLCVALLPLIAISVVAAPVNMVLEVARRQKTQFAWQLSRFAAFGGLIFSFDNLASLGPVAVMAVYSAVATLFYVIFLLLADHALRTIANEARNGL